MPFRIDTRPRALLFSASVTLLALVLALGLSRLLNAWLLPGSDPTITDIICMVVAPLVAGPVGYAVGDLMRRLHQREAELQRLVRIDVLTGLLNRGAWSTAAAAELAAHAERAADCSMLMIDIDHFKSINDRHGHRAGDTALRHVAAAMAATIRRSDLLGRFGGEEFALLLVETAPADAERIADALCKAVAATPWEIDGHHLPVTVSIGVAHDATPGDHALAGLLRRADDAMYVAKAEGRHRVCIADTPRAPATLPPRVSTVSTPGDSPQHHERRRR